jgi:5,10-methylenetetrahydrofolate reductase
VTLTCRDRNSVALEADLAALAELGVAGVHCVTGDARAPHVRPGSTPVFDLDSLRLTELARRIGLTVSVAETPDAEPVDRRPARAADKARAGASWCIVNTGVTLAALGSFVGAVRDLDTDLRFAASIPVFTDAEGARRLQRLPGVQLDEAAVRAVVGAPDPVRAGVERAAAAARDAVRLAGVDGVNLSGPASTAGPVERAAVLRAVMEEIT